MNSETAGTAAGPTLTWLPDGVLQPSLRNALRDLNMRFLGCLRRLPEADLGHLGFASPVIKLLRIGEEEATPLIAACPYALFDARFRHHEYWRAVCAAAGGGGVQHWDPPAPADRPGPWANYAALTELVLFFAWHLASTNPLATRLVLGMSPATAGLIADSALPAIVGVVRERGRLLRPRWPERTLFWERLLTITTRSTDTETVSAQLVGIQLMAAESATGLWSASHRVRRPGNR